MNLIITLLVILLNCYTHADDPDRQLSKCEVCKFLAVELSENLRDHNSTDRLQLSYNLDDMDKRTISYQTSETRLTEVLDSLCARILEYNVHAERSGSNRYAKGRSQTMDSLWGLRNRGVKVVLDVPDDMWDHPSAEITNLEKSCNYMLEEYEDAIRDWYFSKNEEPLTKYLCEDRVLLEQNTSCLYEVYVPSLNDDENGSKNEENTNSDVEDDEVDDSGEVIKKNEAGDDDESVESNESSDKQYENAHRHEDL